MKYKLEYSQTVRRKLKLLKAYLTEQYDAEFAKESLKRVTDRVRRLRDNPELGVDLSAVSQGNTDLDALFENHDHLFYIKEGDKIIVAELFGDKDDYMYGLLGISGDDQDSADDRGRILV